MLIMWHRIVPCGRWKTGTGWCVGAAGGCQVVEDVCMVGQVCAARLPVLRGLRVRYALLEPHLAIMADVDELCYVQHEGQRPIHKQLCSFRGIYLCCPIVVDIKVTRDIQTQSSGIGKIWYISIIPVVDVLHCLALMWGMILGHGKVDMDRFGQMRPQIGVQVLVMCMARPAHEAKPGPGRQVAAFLSLRNTSHFSHFTHCPQRPFHKRVQKSDQEISPLL